MLKHEAVLKPSLISIPPLGDTSFSPGSHSSCPGGAEPAPASAGISTPGDIREHQGGTSLTLAPSTCPRLLLLPCCLFWGHSGRTRTPAPLCTTFQHDWIQPHQNQVSKTTFLLLSCIFFHLSQETIAITRQRTLNARSPSRAGSTQGLGRQGDPALYRCQSNIFDASRDALLLDARASATLTAAEGRGKHKGLLKTACSWVPVCSWRRHLQRTCAVGLSTCLLGPLAPAPARTLTQSTASPGGCPATTGQWGFTGRSLRTVSQIQSNRNRSRFHQQPCPRDPSRDASEQLGLCSEGRNASHCLRGTMRGQNVKPMVGRERG